MRNVILILLYFDIQDGSTKTDQVYTKEIFLFISTFLWSTITYEYIQVFLHYSSFGTLAFEIKKLRTQRY